MFNLDSMAYSENQTSPQMNYNWGHVSMSEGRLVKAGSMWKVCSETRNGLDEQKVKTEEGFIHWNKFPKDERRAQMMTGLVH